MICRSDPRADLATALYRLEREENDRLEADKKVKLLEMKKQLEAERENVKAQGGVVYKGEHLYML